MWSTVSVTSCKVYSWSNASVNTVPRPFQETLLAAFQAVPLAGKTLSVSTAVLPEKVPVVVTPVTVTGAAWAREAAATRPMPASVCLM